jgi:predicted NAD/FAD-binding protein
MFCNAKNVATVFNAIGAGRTAVKDFAAGLVKALGKTPSKDAWKVERNAFVSLYESRGADNTAARRAWSTVSAYAVIAGLINPSAKPKTAKSVEKHAPLAAFLRKAARKDFAEAAPALIAAFYDMLDEFGE